MDDKKKIFAQRHYGLHTLHQYDSLPMVDETALSPLANSIIISIFAPITSQIKPQQYEKQKL